MNPRFRQGLSFVSYLCGLIGLYGSFGLFSFCIMVVAAVKDGLGPGMVSSTGWEAWRRWGEGMIEVSPLFLIPLVLGGLLLWISAKIDPSPRPQREGQERLFHG